MKKVILGTMAVFLFAAAPAFADDYVSLCKATEKDNPNADKMCTCASGKIKADDRDAAMKAMKITADALNGGKTPDTSDPALAKGIAAQMEAEGQCM